ncbi:MAG: T9SS type A sorting domain-containing protein [Bacteroidales bacterium]
MIKHLLRFSLLFLFATPLQLLAQGSWSDDFNSGSLGSGWFGNANYSLSQADGQLKVETEKAAMWASFGVNIPLADIRTNPVINLRIKTDQPIQLTVYVVSDKGNIPVTQPLMASEEFSLVSYYFNGLDANFEVLDSVKTILIAFNGAALSWQGDVYLDDIFVGSAAEKTANIGGLKSQVFFSGTTGHRVFLRGISSTGSLELTGADALLENISFSPVSAEGTSWMQFDCKAGVSGTVTASVLAHGADDFADNTSNFNLTVEENNAPAFDTIGDMLMPPGEEIVLQVKGITDGNAAAEQPIVLSAISHNTLLFDNNFTIEYQPGSQYASIRFIPLSTGTGSITLTADDQQSSNNLFSRTFTIEVLEGWNNKPGIRQVESREVLNTAGEQVIDLLGLNDGDDGSQTLTITAQSSNPEIISDPVLIYTSGPRGQLKFTPVAGKSGFSTITVKVTDNGGTEENNGNQSDSIQFSVETYSPPLLGYVIPFAGETPNAFGEVQEGVRDYWHVEGMGTNQVVSHMQDGGEDVFKIVCTDKFTWTGSWYYTPDMDLTDFPLVSMWVKCDKQIRFHLYFWDESIRNNEDHHLEYTIPANQWTKVEFDFSDAKGMLNGSGEKVNAKRITRILFNYHPDYNWPFTNWSGTVMFKDVRIGDKSGISPTYYCTADPVGPRTFFMDGTEKTVHLSGLGTGKDKNAILSLQGKGILTGLHASPVVNGEASVMFAPSAAGTDSIRVVVSGSPVNGKLPVEKTLVIPVQVLDSSIVTPVALSIDLTQQFQLYRGLGAKSPASDLLDLYTGDFGATAIRFGLLDDNQIEPENDNADPLVLDRSKLNYNAIDWNFVRELKARGVETFLVTYWSPPAWMKQNLSTNYQQPLATWWGGTENKVLPDLYEEYVENAVALVTMFREEAGVDLAGIGLQNEPAFCEPYASAILDPEHFAQLIALVGKRFEDEGISTKLYMAEQVGVKMSDGPIYNNQSYLDAINANAEAKKYSDVFAVHGYGPDGVQPGVPPGSSDWQSTFNAVNASGKVRELWMTETEPAFTGWNDAFVNAANILTAFESGNVNLWTEWAWDGHCINQGKPTQKYWSQSMFRHIKPMARRLKSISGNNDLLVTSWKNDSQHGDKLVIVLMNKGNVPLVTRLDGADLPVDYTVYRVSENVPAFRDGFYGKGARLLLAPRSIVTLVSGISGEPTIDPMINQLVMSDAEPVSLPLSGISDGVAEDDYPVSISVELSDYAVLKDVTLDYTSPNSTAVLHFTPAAVGVTELSLVVSANGISHTEKFAVQVKGYARPNINPVAGPLSIEKGTGTQTVQLAGINDGGDGGQTLQLTAESKSSTPENVRGSLALAYTSPAATGSLSFTPDETGDAVLLVNVTDNGPDSVNSRSIEIPIHVFDYYPPTLQQQNDTSLMVGKSSSVLLRGVTNGGDENQLVELKAESSDESVTGAVTTLLAQRKVYIKPLKAGTALITVTLRDNGSEGKNTASMSFTVTAYNDPSGVAEEQSGACLLYPNPAGSFVYVSMGKEKYTSYQIVDAKGAVLKNGMVSGDLLKVDVSSLSPGSYYFLLESAGARINMSFVKK